VPAASSTAAAEAAWPRQIEQRGDVATGAVDVDVDVLVRVLGLQVDELRADQVGDGVVDRRAQEDDVLLEQAAVEVVGPLATVGLFDHSRDEVAVHTSQEHLAGETMLLGGHASS
jgi:hypothetical protein